MIKTLVVIVCDVCGHTEPAKGETWRNETEYTAPSSWKTSAANPDMHLCPACAALVAQRLKSPKSEVKI